MRVIRTTDKTENLCESCPNNKNFPTCMSEDIEFGNGVGHDNIIACSNCMSKYSYTIYPGEISKVNNASIKGGAVEGR